LPGDSGVLRSSEASTSGTERPIGSTSEAIILRQLPSRLPAECRDR
jgi:hypothetical protein